jgi:uncharacterized protein YuzE
MRLTYDVDADALYVSFFSVERGGVKRTAAGEGKNQGINLDFDVHDRLIGIEVLDASVRFPPAVLRRAEPI